MNPFNKVLAVLAVATLGLWGCAEGPSGRSVNIERTKALEARNTKLEEELRAAQAGREQAKKKLAVLEAERALLQQELDQTKLAAKERDALRQEVKARAGEREALQNQFDQFRKSIRELVGQADAAAVGSPSGQPVTSAADPLTPGKS
jgi:hypothetical protein